MSTWLDLSLLGHFFRGTRRLQLPGSWNPPPRIPPPRGSVGQSTRLAIHSPAGIPAEWQPVSTSHPGFVCSPNPPLGLLPPLQSLLCCHRTSDYWFVLFTTHHHEFFWMSRSCKVVSSKLLESLHLTPSLPTPRFWPQCHRAEQGLPVAYGLLTVYMTQTQWGVMHCIFPQHFCADFPIFFVKFSKNVHFVHVFVFFSRYFSFGIIFLKLFFHFFVIFLIFFWIWHFRHKST